MKQIIHPESTSLEKAISEEGEKFKECYLWLESAMPKLFFQEIPQENLLLIAHSLIGFPLQDYYSTINLKGRAIVLCLDSPDADLRILEHFSSYGIKNYQTFLSATPPPESEFSTPLRIAKINFTNEIVKEEPASKELLAAIKAAALKRNPYLTEGDIDSLQKDFSGPFLKNLTPDVLEAVLDMYLRAKTRDSCQYEVQSSNGNSQIIFAWKNTPKHNFLYRLARTVHRHHLAITKVDATYVNPYSLQSILVMILEVKAAGTTKENRTDFQDFLRELMTVKYFASFDLFDKQLVGPGIISGNKGNVLRAMVNFVHQALLHLDPNIYTLENIEEALCRHPDLTVELLNAFDAKFNPEKNNFERYLTLREEFIQHVNKLDTGQEEVDTRRKNILLQAMSMVHYTLKTNAYRLNLTSLSFRLDPKYLDEIPNDKAFYDRTKKFPEKPFAIFYVKGMHFFGFHIRFQDLARGGLRTVVPEQLERVSYERNNIFSECYHLALTQELKNKDIPEGGAKAVIFLKPNERLDSESEIYRRELLEKEFSVKEIDERIALFRKEESVEYLYQAQRSFIESLIILVNADDQGALRASRILDYYKKPEYLYLGPDENMHDPMIQWIAEYSKRHNYKPGSTFISSKPKVGINHKEYGVTSLGVNVYVKKLLNFVGINPYKDLFTIKMAGGPDGDVAGNEILNLYKEFPKTAKLLSIVDISGTAFDPEGLDLKTLSELFKNGQSIRYYPAEMLAEGGYLVDKMTTKESSALTLKILKKEKKGGGVITDWISGSEMNALLKDNIFKTRTDLFIPAGGRPRTLNETNWKEFLEVNGVPSSKIIVEGANLYLTPYARRELEKLGTLIVKDSSANKTGVICSSFEVLAGLTLGDAAFFANKEILVKEILERLEILAVQEADLLLKEHQKSGAFLTEISAKISERINLFKTQFLNYLDKITLSGSPHDPLIECFLSYCPKFLREKHQNELLKEIPEPHKKAIIAAHLSAQLVYKRGLQWSPSLVDILPLILENNSKPPT